jgi:hypothetical protein
MLFFIPLGLLSVPLFMVWTMVASHSADKLR